MKKSKVKKITTATSPHKNVTKHLRLHLWLHWHLLHRRPDGRQVIRHARCAGSGPDRCGVRRHRARHWARHGRRMHIGLGKVHHGKMAAEHWLLPGLVMTNSLLLKMAQSK